MQKDFSAPADSNPPRYLYSAHYSRPSRLISQCIALPSVKIGTAPLIDTSTAEAAYPTSLDTVHTNTLSGAPTPNEIIELARALGNSPDNIYDFVAIWYVDTVFMFGAQKGRGPEQSSTRAVRLSIKRS